MNYQDMMKVRGKSLQDLIGAMDDDESKRIPGLTIEIISGPGMEARPEAGADLPDDNMDAEDPNMDPFEALMLKKKKEQMNGR